MPDEVFRGILLAGFVVLLPIGLYHRLRSGRSGERLDRRAEGTFILWTLRPVALSGMVGLIAWVARPSSMAWAAMPLPVPVRWVGVGLGLTAGALLVWTFRTLGPNLTDTVVTRAEHSLVTSGPYRWVRHPLYLATLLAALANGLVTANGWVLGCGLAAFALLMIRSRTEERFLRERFGDAYERWRRDTGSVFPKP